MRFDDVGSCVEDCEVGGRSVTTVVLLDLLDGYDLGYEILFILGSSLSVRNVDNTAVQFQRYT